MWHKCPEQFLWVEIHAHEGVFVLPACTDLVSQAQGCGKCELNPSCARATVQHSFDKLNFEALNICRKFSVKLVNPNIV